MANSPQARKRARQAESRRQHNAAMRSMVRTYLK
ncbi:MAG: 30S ribosomal protein S20, partial [Alcanivorax sp.]|nr:30S ribosomal protein S20 [Alcanivorax sp.]